MSVRDDNLALLQGLDYGVEERKDGKVDLYSPKFLFIDQFDDHGKLAEWIKNNIKEEK